MDAAARDPKTTRREELLLWDIIDSAEHIQKYLSGKSFTDFAEEEILMNAVLQRLTVIGEAVWRFPIALKQNNPGVPWSRIALVSDAIVRTYCDVDLTLVWVTATTDTPAAAEAARAIIRNRPPE